MVAAPRLPHPRGATSLVLLSGSGSEKVPRMRPPSEETVRAAANGDDAALEQIVAWLYPVVRKFLGYRFVSLRGGVEDATQECMLEIVRSLPRFEAQGRLEAWALRIAFRTARRLRERESAHTPVDPGSVAEGVFRFDPEDRGLALDVLWALSQIGEKKREALLLTAVLGLTAKEAGQVLGVLTFTVQSRIRHAKFELRALLETEPGSEAPSARELSHG